MEHGARYERMEEFVAVCRQLWDATEADAMVWDRDSGVVGDPTKVMTFIMPAASSRSTGR